MGDDTIIIEQQTAYPREGEIRFHIKQTPARAWNLRIRVPDWAVGARLESEGQTREVRAGEYLEIRRDWKVGDGVTLNLPMQPRLVRAHPRDGK